MQSDVSHLLLALTVVIVVARSVGALFHAVRQPRVVGELVAGIVLGPSVLGRLAPGAFHFLLPPSVAGTFGLVSQVGIVFFMFLVGAELDLQLLRSRALPALAIAQASIAMPLGLGVAMGFALHPTLAPAGVTPVVFALFVGVAMAITAFPVLARLLADHGLQQTPLGTLSLTSAAINDVTAWVLLAFLIGLVKGQIGGVWRTVALLVGFIGAMIGGVRPLLVWALRRQAWTERTALYAALVFMMVSALVAEAIGVHAIFGAFLAGVVVPRETRLKDNLAMRLEDMTVLFFLPPYFAFTGLRTELGLLNSGDDWAVAAAIIVVATAGKFGGTILGGRLAGVPWRMAVQVGVLMNTRGLMELVVLNVGVDLGVISMRLFAMMVLMAVVTTFAAPPLLQALGLDMLSPPPAEAAGASV